MPLAWSAQLAMRQSTWRSAGYARALITPPFSLCRAAGPYRLIAAEWLSRSFRFAAVVNDGSQAVEILLERAQVVRKLQCMTFPAFGLAKQISVTGTRCECTRVADVQMSNAITFSYSHIDCRYLQLRFRGYFYCGGRMEVTACRGLKISVGDPVNGPQGPRCFSCHEFPAKGCGMGVGRSWNGAGRHVRTGSFFRSLFFATVRIGKALPLMLVLHGVLRLVLRGRTSVRDWSWCCSCELCRASVLLRLRLLHGQCLLEDISPLLDRTPARLLNSC